MQYEADNTYERVKERFELEAFKVQDPFCYARIKNKEGELTIFSHVKFSQFYIDWKYYAFDKGSWEERSDFIRKWLRDPAKRVVKRIVCEPVNNQPDVYNTWPHPLPKLAKHQRIPCVA